MIKRKICVVTGTRAEYGLFYPILKKIQETIKFLNRFDPGSTVVFQSDHNWIMSNNIKEKKMIFNLIKINDNCNVVSDINLNNVNALRLIFSCMTGSDPRYIKK